MGKRKYARMGEKSVGFECANEECKWQGTDKEKTNVQDPKDPFFNTLVCPECGHEEFYSLLYLEPKKVVKDAPGEFANIVGTERELGGGLFSGKKEVPLEKYNVLDWRWGKALIMDMNTFEELHPTVELLVKKDGMRASRWTRPFAVREIDLKKEGGQEECQI